MFVLHLGGEYFVVLYSGIDFKCFHLFFFVGVCTGGLSVGGGGWMFLLAAVSFA